MTARDIFDALRPGPQPAFLLPHRVPGRTPLSVWLRKTAQQELEELEFWRDEQ